MACMETPPTTPATRTAHWPITSLPTIRPTCALKPVPLILPMTYTEIYLLGSVLPTAPSTNLRSRTPTPGGVSPAAPRTTNTLTTLLAMVSACLSVPLVRSALLTTFPKSVFPSARSIVKPMVTSLPEYVYCAARLMVCMPTMSLGYVLHPHSVPIIRMASTRRGSAWKNVQLKETYMPIPTEKCALLHVRLTTTRIPSAEFACKDAPKCRRCTENYPIRCA